MFEFCFNITSYYSTPNYSLRLNQPDFFFNFKLSQVNQWDKLIQKPPTDCHNNKTHGRFVDPARDKPAVCRHLLGARLLHRVAPPPLVSASVLSRNRSFEEAGKLPRGVHNVVGRKVHCFHVVCWVHLWIFTQLLNV